MKSRSLVFPSLLTITVAGAVFAQTTTPARPDPITREVNMLTRFLTLTTAQQTAVQGILSADTTNLTTLEATLKADRAALVTAIKGNGGVASAVNNLSSTQAQIETIRASEAAAIYAQLTSDQKTKLGNGLGMIYGGGGGFGFGPGPGGPGGMGARRGPPPQN